MEKARKAEQEFSRREKQYKADLQEAKKELEAEALFNNENKTIINENENDDTNYDGYDYDNNTDNTIIEDTFKFDIGAESDVNQTARVVIQTMNDKMKELANRLHRETERRKESEKKVHEMRLQLSKREREHSTLVELLGEKIERLEYLESQISS